MAKTIENRIKRETRAIIIVQLLGVCILSLLILICAGSRAGESALIGGMAYSLPDLLFVERFIRYQGIKAITGFISRFFAGKMVKLILQGILIAIATTQLPVNIGWVIVGFASCSFLFWTACMMHFSTQRGAV